MKSKLLSDKQSEKSFVLVFETGDEILSELLHFAKEQKISAAHFTAVGACESVTLGFFDLEKKDYEKIFVGEQVEVMSLVGNIALYQNEPKIHSHIVVGKRDGTAQGGHLIFGQVRPTLEMFVSELPQTITRRLNQTTNLPLINLEK